VVNLDVRKKIADLDLPGMPHLGSGITWQWQGQAGDGHAQPQGGPVSVIDMKTWQTVKHHPHARPRLLHAQPRERPTPGPIR
jgi:hypothetical protein